MNENIQNTSIKFVDSVNIDQLKNLKGGTIFRYADTENNIRVLMIPVDEAGHKYSSLLRCIEMSTGIAVHLSPESLVKVPKDVEINLTF